MNLFFVTFPLLIVSLLSFLLRERTLKTAFIAMLWVMTYQFIWIGLLGIGLIQSHIGCPDILDECYVDNYPSSLTLIADLVGMAGVAWVLGSVGQVLANIWHFLRRANRKINS